MSPRLGGNEPSGPTAQQMLRTGTPHERGWTLEEQWEIGFTKGVPRARGDGPSRGSEGPGPGKVPRARGDGNRRLKDERDKLRGSPRARGRKAAETAALGMDPREAKR